MSSFWSHFVELMSRPVIQIGDSTYVNIPRQLVKELGLEENDLTALLNVTMLDAGQIADIIQEMRNKGMIDANTRGLLLLLRRQG